MESLNNFRQKLKRAVERLDAYGAPPDDSPLYTCHFSTSCFYELLDGEEGDSLTLADIRLFLLETDYG